MSSGLHIAVADAPIDRVDADVAIVGCFEDERPLRGAVARADWRLCGAISSLLAAGDLRGSAGEAALFASSGGLRAPRLLTLGLGARSRNPAECLRDFSADALSRLMRLGALRPALALLPHDCAAVRDQVEAFALGLAESWSKLENAQALNLMLVVSADHHAEARRWLAQLAAQPWPAGVQLGDELDVYLGED